MIQELESLVRSGRLDEAKRRLRKVKVRKIPRKDALTYANLARRLDLGTISLKILNPIVRGEGKRGDPPTAAEKVEYAASLRNLGAVSEAATILSAIDPLMYPQANLHLAFCLISEWRYREAVPLLQSYLKAGRTARPGSGLSPSGAAYAIHVAKINLLEALTHEGRFGEAREVLAELQAEVDPAQLSLLHRKMLELTAQLEIRSKRWDQAFRHLEAAQNSFKSKDQDPIGALLIRKWLAVATSLKGGTVTLELNQVRSDALRLKIPEIVRDCDFYISEISGDRETLIRLYFGTPFESYRQRILEALGTGVDLPAQYLWGGRKGSAMEVLNLSLGESSRGKLTLPAGQALHRLLIILSQDFYRPVPLLSIFSKLFPNEFFNLTSPNRVHQVVKRLRAWLRTKQAPMAIDEAAGTYRLSFSGPLLIAVPREPLPLGQRELELLRLRYRLKHGSGFTLREAMSAAGTSKSEMKRLLRWAVETGQVKREGLTHRARYLWIADEG